MRYSIRFSLLSTSVLGSVLGLVLFSLTPRLYAMNPTQGSVEDGAQRFGLLGVCPLESGEKVLNCKIGYRTWGTLNSTASNAILVPMWFTGTSGQLVDSVGPGKLFDSSKYFVVILDPLSNGVSSSPSNSTEQPRMMFPAITIHDMVEAEYALATRVLHLKHVHAVLGTSMGGMQTFEWMVAHPNFMDCSIPIVGSPRLTSYDLLLWRAEEDGVRADPAWQMGNYSKNPALPQVAILHAMNLTTPTHYARETKRDGFASEYAGYGTSGVDSYDANNRIYGLEAMIHQDVAHGGRLEDAAHSVHARVLIVASKQDHMVNPGPALALAPLIHAQTLVLDSDCGHLAPNCEAETVRKAVSDFLDTN